MTKKELIKKLSKYPDDAEVMIQERAMDNAHPVESVDFGWYIDDGMDAPEVIPESEDPEDYGFPEGEKPEKVIVLE